MSRNLLRRAFLAVTALGTLSACTDTESTAPKFATTPQFAQGTGGVWTVNVLTDPGDGVCDDTDCTLREAIAAAAAGDQVVFANTLQGSILLNSQIVIDKSLSVDGDGRITLDAQASRRVVQLTGTYAIGGTHISLAGLTITNGMVGVGAGARTTGDPVVTIRNSVISNNDAVGNAGALFVDVDASVTLVNTTVTGNNNGAIESEGSITILNSTIDGTLGGTAALYLVTGQATVRNTTISGNSTRGIVNGDPGGPTPPGAALTLTSSTLTGNDIGIIHGGSGGNRTWISNSIVVGNVTDGCQGPSGGFFSLGHNIGVGCEAQFDVTGDVNILAGQVFTQVLEQTLKDNGGPTKTHALLARGLAVDAGYCPGETTDQRSFTRPVDDPTMPNAQDGCDIGAYEIQGPQVAVADLMVSQTVDKNSVKQGELLTYTVRVQNLGPQTAPNVVMNNVMSSGVTFVEARQNKGTVTAPPKGETGTVTWNLGDMANQANETAEIVVTVLVRGRTTITNTASVSGDVADPNTANNTAAITVSVATGKTGGKKG
jgi:uncharacterized repeat protein (TIGR01451 family)/CSLREA domain-containing protein